MSWDMVAGELQWRFPLFHLLLAPLAFSETHIIALRIDPTGMEHFYTRYIFHTWRKMHCGV